MVGMRGGAWPNPKVVGHFFPKFLVNYETKSAEKFQKNELKEKSPKIIKNGGVGLTQIKSVFFGGIFPRSQNHWNNI